MAVESRELKVEGKGLERGFTPGRNKGEKNLRTRAKSALMRSTGVVGRAHASNTGTSRTLCW